MSPNKTDEKIIEKNYQKIGKGLSKVVTKIDDKHQKISDFHLGNLIRDSLWIGFEAGKALSMKDEQKEKNQCEKHSVELQISFTEDFTGSKEGTSSFFCPVCQNTAEILELIENEIVIRLGSNSTGTILEKYIGEELILKKKLRQKIMAMEEKI